MSERNLDNLETGESKGLEPASQEQLRQILDMVGEITASRDLEKPNEAEEYRKAKISVTDRLSVEVMKPEGKMADEICAASIIFDWKDGDNFASWSVGVNYAGDHLNGYSNWELDADSVIELGAAPGVLQEYLGQLEKEDYEFMELLGPIMPNKPLTSRMAETVTEFLQDHIELERAGLKEGDIGLWMDPSTGRKHPVLIYRGEEHGHIKHQAMFYLMSPIEEEQDWESKKVSWHDIPIMAEDGQEYVLHTDLDPSWVLRDDVELISKICGDKSEERLHSLHIRYDDIPAVIRQRHYDDGSEGMLDTDHANSFNEVVQNIERRYDEAASGDFKLLSLELEQVVADFCQAVKAETADTPADDDYHRLRDEAWSRIIGGECASLALKDLAAFAMSVTESDVQANLRISDAGHRLMDDFRLLGKPAAA